MPPALHNSGLASNHAADTGVAAFLETCTNESLARF